MDSLFRVSEDYEGHMGTKKPRETALQIVFSLALGISAFVTFCILRPRWKGVYAARKQRDTHESSVLPALPPSLFGWILPLWRISDQQVLASAGLDAYVFLTFFKMAIKFLCVTLFFSLVVIKPVHDNYPEGDPSSHKNVTLSAPWMPDAIETDYLWMYPVFAYVFSAIAMYLIVSETRSIVEVRQEYLGTQTTITDRTIRLSGIPPELQDEDELKATIERLNIGKVESVTLCRKWKELDDCIDARNEMLRKLEEALTVCQGRGFNASLPLAISPSPTRRYRDDEEDGETDEADDGFDARRQLMSSDATAAPFASARPKVTLRSGIFGLRSKQVDAIDYYTERLHDQDDQIAELRKRKFDPTPLAFVTMDSVAACQMACQAVLDPSPLQLLARPSPAPSDVVWQNTYMTRKSRMFRAWFITALILLLTVFWSVVLVPVATALNTDAIRKVFPSLADALENNRFANSLVTTQLPTLIISLLNVAVPFFYLWLANCQGMTSYGDIELSVISKNFFFTFFNFFIIFTVLGTASNFFQYIGDSLKDATQIAYTLARSLQRLLKFYVNFIVLQGLGLFPFRLLQFGTIAMYPISLMGAKTPRDYAELVQPPTFSYGFYLPQTLLIFIICIVYSVLRESWKVILSGLIYFVIGGFVYKYQLLYAMDHRQHSGGRGWTMICNRVIVGIVLFQVTVGGQLAANKALVRSASIIPLIVGTAWFAHVYGRTYNPLMESIALRSIKRGEHGGFADVEEEEVERAAGTASGPGMDDDDAANVWSSERRYESETAPRGETVDESVTTGRRFINPSLTCILEKPWVARVEAQ